MGVNIFSNISPLFHFNLSALLTHIVPTGSFPVLIFKSNSFTCQLGPALPFLIKVSSSVISHPISHFITVPLFSNYILIPLKLFCSQQLLRNLNLFLCSHFCPNYQNKILHICGLKLVSSFFHWHDIFYRDNISEISVNISLVLLMNINVLL